MMLAQPVRTEGGRFFWGLREFDCEKRERRIRLVGPCVGFTLDYLTSLDDG